jgi:D-arabinose 1-dehydrogenase-like Zn-dependent alcohol dehydrogenase
MIVGGQKMTAVTWGRRLIQRIRRVLLNSAERTMIETYPLDRVAEAYSCMMNGKAQFGVVLTM